MKITPTIPVALASALILLGCGKASSPDSQSPAPTGGAASASLACTRFVEALEAGRWDSVADALQPSQRPAAAAWLARGLLNAHAILDAMATPLMDTKASRARFQNIWTSAGVDPRFLSDLQAQRDPINRPSPNPFGISNVQSLAEQHLRGANPTKLIAACLAFERKFTQDADQDAEMETFGRAKLLTPDEIAKLPRTKLSRIGLSLKDPAVMTNTGILKPVQVGNAWFLQIVTP